MAQPSVKSYFNTRKRQAYEDISSINRKIILLDPDNDAKSTEYTHTESAFTTLTNKPHEINEYNEIKCSSTKRSKAVSKLKFDNVFQDKNNAVIKKKKISECSKTTIQAPDIIQPKIVKFIKMGNLSPKKNLSPIKGRTSVNVFNSLESISNAERGMKTPTKNCVNPIMEKLNSERQDMPLDEIKKKLKKSTRLNELKASIHRIQELDSKLKKSITPTSTSIKSLKEFDSIELEIISPQKQFTSPRKLLPVTPQKNELMSPRKLTPNKILFSPTKERSIPAYQKYQDIAESTQLPLPFKYRCLAEMFKCCESVCAMFHNRRETITFKKLKPAVQRMLRKNFTEENLSQIQNLFPDAYTFSQVKMRNFGSTSKQDTYQLVIVPNVVDTQSNKKAKQIDDEDDVIQFAQNTIMNPQIIISRQQHFHNILLEKVKELHATFLNSLIPPMSISKDRIKRWHPEFDLEKCPNIELGNLPQPPNIEKFSSAKEILSTARNLFNCATPMEKSMDRLATKIEEDKDKVISITQECIPSINESLLKGVPKSLLEKIRAKQTAKALDAMTRRPSQDKEAIKYGRLPELARYIRNVFVTERKSVLPLENILEKIENSYRAILSDDEIENLLRLISTEVPKWLSFHIIRKTNYIKISKDEDMNTVLRTLESIANSKAI